MRKNELMSEIDAIEKKLESITDEQRKIEILERQLAGARGECNSLRKDNQRLVSRNIQLSDTLDQHAALQLQDPVIIRPVKHTTKRDPHSAIALIQWSDWHVAEVVEKSKTNGRNAFNPEICRKRVSTLVENTLALIDLHRQHVRIDEMVLVLGGDFITGYLHEELAQTNAMGVTQEVNFARELLEGSVGAVLASADMKNTRVVCLRGNHGRTTKKIQFKNDYETSYESLLYWTLRDRLSGDKVEWVVPETDISYTTLTKGYDLRAIHGHQVKYQGGIGGISVPLSRWIVRQDQTRKAVITMLGHFHTYNPASMYAICSCLKGYDEYAQSLGFPYEPPTQLFMLFDCKRNHITARYPIFVE
jgi:hypothetical protein